LTTADRVPAGVESASHAVRSAAEAAMSVATSQLRVERTRRC
jgi:hypothetical protein